MQASSLLFQIVRHLSESLSLYNLRESCYCGALLSKVWKTETTSHGYTLGPDVAIY